MRIFLTLISAGFLLVFCCGFDGCLQTETPSAGFPVESVDRVELGPIGYTEIPHPGAVISGTYLSDDGLSPAYGSTDPFTVTTPSPYAIAIANNRRVWANWSSQVRWNEVCGDQTTNSAYFDVNPVNGIKWYCLHPVGEVAPNTASTHFTLQGSSPSTLTVNASSSSPLSTADPTQLYVYNRAGSLVNAISSSSIASDGSSGTFAFPDQSTGASLTPDIYGLSIIQNGATVNGVNFLAVGGADYDYSQPFGVAAVGGTLATYSCEVVDRKKQCTNGSGTYYYPVITLYGSSQVVINGTGVTVGVNPTSVTVFDDAPYTTKTINGDVTTYSTYTGPSRALVTNTGSNTVSIIDVNTRSILATLSVGRSPVAAAISSDGSTAYIANYGDGTVSVLNLSSLSISSTLSVGGNPLSLAIDNQGYLWIGETSFIKLLNLSSGGVTNSIATSGPVTSLAYSVGQADLITTIGLSNGNIQANIYPASDLRTSQSLPGATISTSVGISAQYASAATTLSDIPNVQILASGTLVSNDSANSLTVSASSTGFVVTEIPSNTVVMEGATPGPVRSIAVDPQNQVAYLTVPDHNLVITLPLPGVATN